MKARIVAAKPRHWPRPEPGVRKGIAGRGFREMEGTPGHFSGRSFTRAVSRAVLAAFTSHVTREQGELGREATGVSEARHARIVMGRERPRGEMRDEPSGKSVQVRRSESHCRGTGGSSPVLARERRTRREPTMRGYWYEEVRWQKSVQRIARCDVRQAARRVGGVTLAEERSRDVLTHVLAASR